MEFKDRKRFIPHQGKIGTPSRFIVFILQCCMDEFRHGSIAFKARFGRAGIDDFYNTPFSHPYPVFNQFIDVFISERKSDDN
jgi:hypothetical protein